MFNSLKYINQYLDTLAEWGEWSEMGSCKAFNGTCGSRIHHRTGPVLHSSSEFELPCSFGYSTMKCKEDISKIERCDKFDKCRKTPFLSGTGSLGDGLTKPKNATFMFCTHGENV